MSCNTMGGQSGAHEEMTALLAGRILSDDWRSAESESENQMVR